MTLRSDGTGTAQSPFLTVLAEVRCNAVTQSRFHAH